MIELVCVCQLEAHPAGARLCGGCRVLRELKEMEEDRPSCRTRNSVFIQPNTSFPNSVGDNSPPTWSHCRWHTNSLTHFIIGITYITVSAPRAQAGSWFFPQVRITSPLYREPQSRDTLGPHGGKKLHGSQWRDKSYFRITFEMSPGFSICYLWISNIDVDIKRALILKGTKCYH